MTASNENPSENPKSNPVKKRQLSLPGFPSPPDVDRQRGKDKRKRESFYNALKSKDDKMGPIWCYLHELGELPQKDERDSPAEYIERLLITENRMTSKAQIVIDQFVDFSKDQRYQRKLFATTWCAHYLDMVPNREKPVHALIDMVVGAWNNAATVGKELGSHEPQGHVPQRYDTPARNLNGPIPAERMEQFYKAIARSHNHHGNRDKHQPPSDSIRNPIPK